MIMLSPTTCHACICSRAPAGTHSQSSTHQHLDADDHVEQQLDAHIQVLMQTLRPDEGKIHADVTTNPVTTGLCNNLGATIIEACLPEAGGCETDQQPINGSPVTAAHLLHCNAAAWGLFSPSPQGDIPAPSVQSAPEDTSGTFHECYGNYGNPFFRHDANPRDGCLDTDPNERFHPCGAREQLQALHQINRLQQAGMMKRKSPEVSQPPCFSCP